jgi:hypothetical protein
MEKNFGGVNRLGAEGVGGSGGAPKGARASHPWVWRKDKDKGPSKKFIFRTSHKDKDKEGRGPQIIIAVEKACNTGMIMQFLGINRR